jgi:CheY-like chemotaxis protein
MQIAPLMQEIGIMDKKGRVLVIEDDMMFCQLLATALKRAGYDSLSVQDGLSALEVIASYRPHLIFLDMYLPGLNGWDFLAKYRDLPDPKIPIIATSASNIDRNSLGEVVEFVPKPFRMHGLIQLIEQTIQHSC